MFHTKKRQAKLRAAEVEREEAEADDFVSCERAKRAKYLKPPEISDQHALAACWQHIALPAYYAAIHAFLVRVENDESPDIAKTSLTDASYGGCSTCTAAINLKIAEIPCD